jgi:hypothetical protein
VSVETPPFGASIFMYIWTEARVSLILINKVTRHKNFSGSGDFFVLPNLKITLKGRRFQTVQDMTTNRTNDLRRYHRHPLNSASKSGNGGGRKGTIIQYALNKER